MANRKLKYLLMALGSWLGLTVILGSIQLHFLTQAWWPIPLGIIFGAGIFYFHIFLYQKYSQKKSWARKTLYLYAFINLIPLMLQLSLLKEQGIDNVVSAVIAFLIIYSLE